MDFTRRRFIEGTAALVGVSLAGCGAKNGAEAGNKTAARAGAGGAIILTGMAPLQAGVGQQFKFPDGEPGLLFQSQSGENSALSAKCTHAGCAVEWDGRAKIPLRCPCHESQFALDGRVLSGPAKAPLKRYSVALKGEEVTLTPL